MSIVKTNYLFGISLFLIQSFLILTTKINVWPEMYFFTWLVSKGLLPYRDFFDHHGFLLYLIMSPFSSNFSFFKIFYYLIRSSNLVLFLLLLKNSSKGVVIFLVGVVYVLLSYFFSENILWYETVITTDYLLICLVLLNKEFRFKSLILGILVTISSFIKPTAFIIIIPLILLTKNFRIIIAPIFLWLMKIYYLNLNDSLPQFFEAFSYNSFLLRNYRFSYISDVKILLATLFLGLWALFICIWERKLRKAIICYTLFSLTSLIFLTLGYGRVHILPVITFLILIVGSAYTGRLSRHTKVLVCAILIYCLFLTQKVKHHYINLQENRTSWMENVGSEYAINYLKGMPIINKSVYVFGNHPEIYMRLNIFPPTYFPIKFPLTELYFSNYQRQLDSELENNHVQYVIINKPIKEYQELNVVLSYIKENYKILEDTQYVSIYGK